MGIIRKIRNHVSLFYRQTFVCEQYPMLTSISRKKLLKDGALGVVFMLHHITQKDPKKIPTNEDLKVAPHFLEKIILSYKSKGFRFISLDELCLMISQNEINETPFVAFTIDDGYLDNYTQAYPIFKKYQIPFTIFVATDFIDQKAILWWDSLEELILSNKSITTSEGITYPCETYRQRWDTFRLLREKILSFKQDNLRSELDNLFDRYKIDWLAPIRNQAMSWEQISILSKDSLCAIGGHTVSHPALNQVSEERFNYEIRECITKLETATKQKIHHFAFPYGTKNEIGEREFKLISKFNFDTIFMAHGGCITKDDISMKNRLPRVYLHDV